MRRLALPLLPLVTIVVTGTDAEPARLASGDDYTVLGALAELPASTADDDLLIQTADVATAIELAGLQRTDDLDIEAVLGWIGPLTGVVEEGAEWPPVFVPFGDVFNIQRLRDVAEFDAALGWSVVGVDAFVEQSSPPDSFAVVTGDFDDGTLSPDLVDVGDGVVSFGEGDDFEPGEPSAVSAIGAPLRLAQDGDRIAASRSTPFVAEWGAGASETLADAAPLAAVAGALDEADVAAAVIAPASALDFAVGGLPENAAQIEALLEQVDEQVPPAPYDVVGFGWSVVDGESLITVAYHFSSSEDAAASVDALERLYTEGVSFQTQQPLSELLTFRAATATDDVVAVSLTVPEGSRPQVIFNMLMVRDLPFVSR